MEEQTGTEMVLEEQKETVETQGSTLLEQEETAPEVTEANTEVQDSAAELEVDAAIDISAEAQDVEDDIEPQASEKPKNPNAKWYILQAYSGYEGRVEQTILEKLKIEGLEHLDF